MALDTLEKVRGAVRRRIDWTAFAPSMGGGFLNTVVGTTWGGASTTIPFTSAPTGAGYNPTSLTYNGATINALDAPALIVDMQCVLRHGTWFVFDLLWHWQDTTTVAATPVPITGQPTLPARDVDGASAGRGCFAVAWSSATNVTIDILYTNSAGASGNAASVFVPTGAQGGPHIFPLAGGDTGVSSIDSVTSSGAAGVNVSIVRLVAVGVDPASPITTNGTGSPIPTGHPLSYLHPVQAGSMLFPVMGGNAPSNQAQNPSIVLAMDY